MSDIMNKLKEAAWILYELRKNPDQTLEEVNELTKIIRGIEMVIGQQIMIKERQERPGE